MSYAAWAVGSGALLIAASARAECPVALVPADAPAAWGSASRAAAARLGSPASLDCGSIEIAVRPSGGALLTFIAKDGRRALRALMSPEEIAPALEALLVTLPPEPVHTGPAAALRAPAGAEPPASAPPAPSPTPAQSLAVPAVPVRSTAVAAPAPSPETHFVLGGSAGVRLGVDGVYVSPAIALRPSGTFGAWELAGAVELDPSYAYLPGGVPPGFKLWSFIAGVQVGRRESLGSVAVGYGLGLGVASIREEANDTAGNAVAVDFGQPRATLYGRLVFPRRASVRATFDLAFDAALANFKKSATLRKDLPELPRWGILVSAGVETSAL